LFGLFLVFVCVFFFFVFFVLVFFCLVFLVCGVGGWVCFFGLGFRLDFFMFVGILHFLGNFLLLFWVFFVVAVSDFFFFESFGRGDWG